MSTKQAAAGEFQSSGEDFVHYKDQTGDIKYLVEGDGTSRGQDFITASGASLNEVAARGGLPSDVDCGVAP